MLRMYGHIRVAVLDGGWQKWEKELLPTKSGNKTNPSQTYPAIRQNTSLFVSSIEMLNKMNTPAYRIIDVRSTERYRGEFEPIDPVAGHIPGALNRPISDNLTNSGIFKSPEVLRLEIQEMLGNALPQNTIVYCGSGVTSCHLILAMEIAGLEGAKVYTGSWSEWIRDPRRPVAK
jgi:thiosulfate/3-mercaptopyruvate sulfurtransferase